MEKENNSIDERMGWIAARTFSDEHYGRPITEGELEFRLNLEQEMADSIDIVKSKVINSPKFESLSYENKIRLVASTLESLENQKEFERMAKNSGNIDYLNPNKNLEGLNMPNLSVNGEYDFQEESENRRIR